MYKTEPFVSKKVWGYELWTVSTHKNGPASVNGKKLSAVIGDDYPLLIKIIQANDTLSVQVHPDNIYAAEKEHASGKTECWYVLDAEPDSTLISGIADGKTKTDVEDAIKKQDFTGILHQEPVSKGDFVFIPSGTVHAIQGGLRLLEIQQPSDVTYRLYDWGRPRELHIKQSLEVLKTSCSKAEKNFTEFTCEYFSLKKLNLKNNDKINIKDFDFKTPSWETGWITVFILNGSGTFTSTDGSNLEVKKEDSIMVKTTDVLKLTTAQPSLDIMLIG